jgi:hypothetical protein
LHGSRGLMRTLQTMFDTPRMLNGSIRCDN